MSFWNMIESAREIEDPKQLAYDEGEQAFYDGKERHHCPYAAWDELAVEWHAGFDGE